MTRQRYSVRAFKPGPVEEEELEQVLEAARLGYLADQPRPKERKTIGDLVKREC